MNDHEHAAGYVRNALELAEAIEADMRSDRRAQDVAETMLVVVWYLRQALADMSVLARVHRNGAKA